MLTFDQVLFRHNDKNIVEKIRNVGEYEVTYFYHKNDKNNVYIFDDLENDTLIHLSSDNIEKTIDEFVENEVIKNKKIFYGIIYRHEEMLKNVFDNIGYHVSGIENRENILSHGLKANGNTDYEVLLTSCYLDNHKTKNIPKDFFRSACIYLHSEMSIYELGSYKKEREVDDRDLYAVDISGIDWRIASQGLSGFCLYIKDYCSFNEWFSRKEIKKYVRDYWRNSYSKQEYLSQSDEVIKSDKNWGLDEILVMQPLTNIERIGTFTSRGFVYEECLSNYIRDEYKTTFREVLGNIYET